MCAAQRERGSGVAEKLRRRAGASTCQSVSGSVCTLGRRACGNRQADSRPPGFAVCWIAAQWANDGRLLSRERGPRAFQLLELLEGVS